jgi:hypothetical protein
VVDPDHSRHERVIEDIRPSLGFLERAVAFLGVAEHAIDPGRHAGKGVDGRPVRRLCVCPRIPPASEPIDEPPTDEWPRGPHPDDEGPKGADA